MCYSSNFYLGLKDSLKLSEKIFIPVCLLELVELKGQVPIELKVSPTVLIWL